jgi:hypothetical protein
MALSLKLSKKIFRYISLSIIPIIWLILIGFLYYRNSQHSVLESAPKISFDSGEVILREEWKRIYLNNEPVGYSKVLLQEGVFASRRVYVLNNETNLYLLVAGTNQNIKLIGNATLDKDLTLLQFNQELYTGGQRLRVRGIFGQKHLRLWINSGAGETERILPLQQRCYSTEAINLILLRDKFPLGKKYRIPIFDPTTLSADELEVEIIKKTEVEINKIKYPAFEVQQRFKGLTQTVWINPKGEALKEEATLAGLNLVSLKELEPDKAELQVVHRSSQDLLLTSSIPANRELANPRETYELTVRLNNVPEQQLEQIKQTGQIFGKETAKNSIELQIKTNDLARIPPYTEQVNTKQFIKYLAPSALVQSADPNIAKTAKKIAGNERDSVRGSVKLTRWVYRNIRKKILVSVPSAVDVLKYREGDCNEHSVLFAALARSVGIPTKIVAGLVYKDGYFFYHAWNEVWVGQWVPVDATFGQTAVDATHIKLIEGDLDQQIQLLSLVGKINIEIL